MTRHIALLRGVNLGSHRRVSMPELRELLGRAGFEEVRTYVQSGNVVLSSALAGEQLARACERAIAEQLGLEVEVVVRTRDELAEVVRRDPLGRVATNPKRYQVTFLAAEPPAAVAAKLDALDCEPEQYALCGRELYSWHPDGVGRSKLWARLAKDGWLGVTATARNWTTATTLLNMADER
ncbi:MAG: DUF1697 domain-containing protein [Solirubrobacterales bacterium]|nr:DUF1697 domain-containing protein [Solirubrobacterales bacterium]